MMWFWDGFFAAFILLLIIAEVAWGIHLIRKRRKKKLIDLIPSWIDKIDAELYLRHKNKADSKID